MQKIIDEFTNLPVSRQRKEQLRHPDRYKARYKKLSQTKKFKQRRAKYMKQWRLKQKYNLLQEL